MQLTGVKYRFKEHVESDDIQDPVDHLLQFVIVLPVQRTKRFHGGHCPAADLGEEISVN